jgi:Fe-coproporphyrin III synthase
MFTQPLYHTFQRYRTLQTDRISALPIVILMPHSACNCQCVMCDIWKGNQQLRQLNVEDISGLINTLRKFNTKQVLMSGGEALLNPNFFRFCAMLKDEDISVTLLSTGLTLKRNAASIVRWVNQVIVSLDGDEKTHDAIRNVPGAFGKLKEGIIAIKSIDPAFQITGRTVIHRLNYRRWPFIITSAQDIGLDQISFLPADVSSQAFNREIAWNESRQHEILLTLEDLPQMEKIINQLTIEFNDEFHSRFIAESPEKIKKIHGYYSAHYGLNGFPYKKCNAPWVSTVIEADGNVRPCFFHPSIGNIRENSLDYILNSEKAVHFRKTLNMKTNSICVKCVCYLNLSPLDRGE